MAIATGVVAIYVSVRKAPAEASLLKSQSLQAEAYASKTVSEAVTNLLKPLQERIDELETAMAALNRENEQLYAEIRALKRDNDDLRNWANKLAYQVTKQFGGIPVEFKKQSVRME